MPRPCGSDWLITGLPRAGTTLLTALVDGLVQSVALSEPDALVERARATEDGDCLVRDIVQFHRQVRRALRAGEPVADIRAADGQPFTDYLCRTGAATIVEKPSNTIDRSALAHDFLLASKHNALYTALLLPLLDSGRFKVLAVVREPLDLLRSWATVPFPIGRGRLPGAERYWPALAELAEAAEPVKVRQAMIMEAIVARYVSLADRITVLRYEEVLADPRRIAVLMDRAARVEVPIRPRPKEPLPASEKRELQALLKDHAPTAWALYH